MSQDPAHSIPPIPEVDQHGGDELPSYEDLAAQNGPNSRFGRWKGWIEKRAAERYADLTPEDLHRRRQRGWGDNSESSALYEEERSYSSSHHAPLQLHIQTDLSLPPTPAPTEPEAPLRSIGEVISPSRLSLYQFGSRFLPHSRTPPRCLLPILNDTLLLIGHDEGLSVLNMYPKVWTDEGLVERGPNDAEVHHIWTGEGIYQMDLLEAESTGAGTPQGVVLALVGPEGDSPKDQETVRAIRMYNLASLINLAKWAIVQEPGVLPLRLNGLKCTQARTHLKHRSNIAKGLRGLKLDSPIPQSAYGMESNPSFPSVGSTPTLVSRTEPHPHRSESAESTSTIDSSWDVVDDLPLRWATDFVPLAANGSRMCNLSVLAYDVWHERRTRQRGNAYLAVAVKSNIFMYYAAKGERAFRLVKEFYTPITVRSIAFVQQSVQDMSRSPSDVTPRSRGHSPNLTRHAKGMSVGGVNAFYPAQLSLFTMFEKKAGLIRIADSAVGEVELLDDGVSSLHQQLLSPGGNSSLTRRSRSSWDGKGFVKDNKSPWIAPTKVTLSSTPGLPSLTQNMYILTRGKHSHLLPYPLPANIASTPAFRVLHWSSPPAHVQTRTCHPKDGSPSFLQVIAFSDDGVEVQELDLSAITERKGKGREPIRAQSDVGGCGTGFLVVGGHWDKQAAADFSPTIYEESDTDTLSEMSSEELAGVLHAQEGIYAWMRKDAADWRIVWLGNQESERRCDLG